jgi:predicted extracellular nuclease
MKPLFLTLFFSFIIVLAFAQDDKEYTVMFYNVENFFDTKNDSLSNDDEFTAAGERHWTWKRFEQKVQHTGKAIIAAGGWQMPDVIGLCEIENKYVLQRLLKDTPLKKVSYRIIHKESPDHRGIDVSLLYNPQTFYPLSYEYYPLKDEFGDTISTRELMYVSGVFGEKDTVHVFVNHWPSRYAGVMETRRYRKIAAILLKEKCEALWLKNKFAKIIVVGDFNDQPQDESIKNVLGAKLVSDSINSSQLYNLSSNWLKDDMGTLKYQSQWFVFDQIIVSGSLLHDSIGLHTNTNYATVCQFPFLFENDKTYGGKKLFRTYNGYKYNGGFSDHLPVLLKLIY